MSALLTHDSLIIFRGDTCFSHNLSTKTFDDRGQYIQQLFDIPSSRIEAVLRWDEETVFFFKGMDCWKYDLLKKSVMSGYPKKNLFAWKGIWLSDIADAVRIDNKVLFFRKTQYSSYDINAGQADLGYPKPIAEEWHGVWDSIDGVEYPGQGKILFFKGDHVIRYDLNRGEVDSPYPLTLDEFVRSYGLDNGNETSEGKDDPSPAQQIEVIVSNCED